MQGIDPSIGCSCILQWFSLFAAVMNEWGEKKSQLASKQPSKPSVLAPSQKKIPVFCLHLEFLKKGIGLDKRVVGNVDQF